MTTRDFLEMMKRIGIEKIYEKQIKKGTKTHYRAVCIQSYENAIVPPRIYDILLIRDEYEPKDWLVVQKVGPNRDLQLRMTKAEFFTYFRPMESLKELILSGIHNFMSSSVMVKKENDS